MCVGYKARPEQFSVQNQNKRHEVCSAHEEQSWGTLGLRGGSKKGY